MATYKELRLGILVINDEVDVARTIVQVLSGHGYDAWTMSDPIKACEEAEKRRPDLILLEFDMPKLLGSEVSTLLKSRSHTRDIPIVVLSGMTDEDTPAVARMSGGAAYIGKPFKENELFETIRRITTRH